MPPPRGQRASRASSSLCPPQRGTPRPDSAGQKSFRAQRPDTFVGVSVEGVVAGLAPSWPLSFEPQHERVPTATAQVWFAPAATATTPDENTLPCSSSPPPEPRWWRSSRPQHRRACDVRSAQVWARPATTSATFDMTSCGDGWLPLAETPSWLEPCSPQQKRSPPEATAQL